MVLKQYDNKYKISDGYIFKKIKLFTQDERDQFPSNILVFMNSTSGLENHKQLFGCLKKFEGNYYTAERLMFCFLCNYVFIVLFVSKKYAEEWGRYPQTHLC